MPKVSVIIPTYNRADVVGGAIQSVLDQTYTDWELIVVDDGSQDNTRDVVASYDDPRIRYIHQDNMKLPGARNTGIRASTGQYIAFLDSDDLFLPGKLQLQVDAMDRDSDIGLVASVWMEVDAQHKTRRTLCPWQLKPELTLTHLLYDCPFSPCAVLVRRNWLVRVGLFDAQQHYVEDWDLWLRLAYAGCRMVWEPEVAWLRVIHKDGLYEGNMAHHADHMIAGLFRLLDKFFAQPNLPDAVRQQHDRVYARAHIDGAVRAFGAGMVAEGEKHLAAAIRLNPALLEGEPPVALQSLASTALTHLVGNVDQYVADVCQHLPQVSPKLVRSPRQMRAIIRATAAFDDLANDRRQQARLKAAWALLTDPVWLRNRGLLSILLKP